MRIRKLIISIVILTISLVFFSTACSQKSVTTEMEGSGKWQQKEFIIGAYDGVRMTGEHEKDMEILKTFSDAGIGMMVGTHYWYTSRYFDRNYINHNPNAVSNKYILELMAAFNKKYGKNKVRLITTDREICNDKIPINKEYREDNFTNYLELSQDLRDCLYGYNLIDEPELKRLRECLPAIRSAKEIDKEKMIYVNLGNTGEDFRTCAKELAENSSIISFDIYNWITSNEKPSRKVSEPLFELTQIMAEEARNANVPWWGVALSIEHEKRRDDMKILWGFKLHDPDNRNPKTELARVRFGAYSYLIYGAKGLVWYMYDTSNCPITNPDRIEPYKDIYIPYSFHDGCLDYDGNPSIFYDYVKEINMKITNMGSILMDLNWLTTVHGMSYNNYGDVPHGSLPVVEADTPVVASITKDSTLAVGIFEGKDNNKYLMLMNKDIDNDKSYTLDLKNAKKVSLFKSNTKKWEPIELTTSGSVTVDVETGDLELLRIIEK